MLNDPEGVDNSPLGSLKALCGAKLLQLHALQGHFLHSKGQPRQLGSLRLLWLRYGARARAKAIGLGPGLGYNVLLHTHRLIIHQN